MKKWIIRLGVAIVLLFFLVIFDTMGGFEIVRYALENDSQDSLSFSFSRCDDDSGHWINEVRSQKWQDNQLIVEGAVFPNCGANWLFGSYEFNGSELSLNYKPVIGYFFACECKKNVVYQISDIPRRKYHVTFREEEPLVYYPFINMLLFDEQ